MPVIEVEKKDGESNDSLIRRFTRKVQQSGILIHSKKSRFREQKPNKRKIREDALRRVEIREKNEYLRKIGKLEEQPKGFQKGFQRKGRQSRPSR